MLKELNDNKSIFEKFVERFPEPAISHRPSEHQWSIKEILCHLVDIQEVVAGRISMMLEEENPAIELYDEEQENRERDHSNDDIGAYKATFISTRDEVVSSLAGKDSAWQRRGRHPLNPDFTVEFVVNDMLDHEHLHFEQIHLITTRM
jgi:hypothetical protein